jgi:hypothetical protein
MLDLQAANLVANKENFPPIPNPQNKILTPQLNQVPPKPEEACGQTKC